MAPLVDPGTDLEDEWPSRRVYASLSEFGRGREGGACPLGGGSLAGDGDVHCIFCGVGFSMTLATYPVPPLPMMSFVDWVPLDVASPAGLAVGNPTRSEALLHQVSSLLITFTMT